MFPASELETTVNLHSSKIRLNLPKESENLTTSSETTPTLNEKADEDTESAGEHFYIIENNKNTAGDKLADKVVIEVDGNHKSVRFQHSLGKRCCLFLGVDRNGWNLC